MPPMLTLHAILASATLTLTGSYLALGVSDDALPDQPPASQPDAPPASQPAAPPAPAPAGAEASAPDPAVVALLDDLEASARTLEAFTANVHYETEDDFFGPAGRVIRKGNLIYHVDHIRRSKSFAILFDTVIEGGRKDDRSKEYIFRDGWLVERDRTARVFVKRQVVPPGAAFDPLKLGEGPIPLPIGQPRQQVLDRFGVELIELPEEGPLARLRGTVAVDGLRLVPHPGTPEAKDFDRIDLFYDRVTRLPVGINLVEPNGDRKTARLDAVVRNPELTVASLRRISIALPEDASEWHVDVRPLE